MKVEVLFFFFSSRRRHTRLQGDWSSDVCSSDLELVKQYKALVKERTKTDFPEDPRQQFQGAINAVFGSWRNPRAIHYRRMNKISEELGTAGNVQRMWLEKMGTRSVTGVGFPRNP